MLETVTHENEFHLHSQYKAMIQTKMTQKLKQGKLDFTAAPDSAKDVDVAAGDVSDEPVPELGQHPVCPVVDVQVREDHRVEGVGTSPSWTPCLPTPGGSAPTMAPSGRSFNSSINLKRNKEHSVLHRREGKGVKKKLSWFFCMDSRK